MQEHLAAAQENWATGRAFLQEQDVTTTRAEDCPVPETALRMDTAQVGLWAGLATISMLFAGFTSAYLVRRSGADWQPVSLPRILWLNTGLLLASSIALEIARARMKKGRREALKLWLGITLVLGLGFLMGQILAWERLAAQGVYLPTSPHSSFFYMLTAVHGLHLLGGILALLYAVGRASRASSQGSLARGIGLSATYWHFVGGIWLYLFVLLAVS